MNTNRYRKMKKKLILAALLGVCSFSVCTAQSVTPEVVASQGDYSFFTGGSVSWTLGELSSETYTAGSNVLTQGFQQPGLLLSQGIGQEQAFEIKVYPNPVQRELTISFSDSRKGRFLFELFNIQGEKLSSGAITMNAAGDSYVLPFADYVPGIYLVNVKDEDGKSAGSFRICKVK